MAETDWIERLGLEPHPEGGWFRRIHTEPMAASGTRPAVTSIHYLLTTASPLGAMHRNASTILHYLQDGGPVDYRLLGPDGVLSEVRLSFAPTDALFLAVPGDTWKGSRLAAGASHALVSEAVVPGFDYADHDFLTEEMLVAAFPQHAAQLRPWLRKV